MIRFFFVLLIFTIACVQNIAAQVPGCTDPMASNYSTAATVNNGSCTYNPVNYIPPVVVDPISDTLVESSGLQWAGGSLWSFNDGGGAAAIYRIDTASNAILQTVNLAGATNVDWEDIAFDGTRFYVGDFGNNANGARTDLKIYTFLLSAIPAYNMQPVVTIPDAQIGIIYFTYSNQPQPPQPVAANSTAFDCEAMIVDSGQIHLFTKNWTNLTTTHYTIDNIAAGNYVAIPVETLATNFLVTAADKAPGYKLLALLGYQNTGTGSHFIQLLSGYSGGNYFNGNVRKLNLPDALTMGQAEGIAFRDSAYGYISNEKFVRSAGPFTITVNQKLRSFTAFSYASVYPVTYTFTGNGNWNTAANWLNGNMPATVPANGSSIFINPATGGRCELNIPYRLPLGCLLTVQPGKAFLVQGNLTIEN